MKHFPSIFLVLALVSLPAMAEEEVLPLPSPAGPFLEVEHASSQDHIFYNFLVTDDQNQVSLYKKDFPAITVVLTDKTFAGDFARLAKQVSEGMDRDQCGSIEHPEYSYAVTGRILGFGEQEFCFILNPCNSTRLQQRLLIESLKNNSAPSELRLVLDRMLARMPHGSKCPAASPRNTLSQSKMDSLNVSKSE